MARFLRHLHRLSHLDEIGGDIHPAAVHQDMVVKHQLAGLGPGVGKAQTVDHVVQAPFQQHQEISAGDPAHALRPLEVTPELLLQDAVHTLYFLLFPELQTVIGNFAPTLTVLSRRVVAPLNGAFVGIAAITFEV